MKTLPSRGKLSNRVPLFMGNSGFSDSTREEYPLCPNCSDEESDSKEEPIPGELGLYDECGILRPRYRDLTSIGRSMSSDDFVLALKKITDVNGGANFPQGQNQNGSICAKDLSPLVPEGGLVYGPRSFIMPYTACAIEDLAHCDPSPAEIAYLSDSESIKYLEGVRKVGGSGRKPLPSTRTNGHEGPVLRPATIQARLRSFLHGLWDHFKALVYLTTLLFKSLLLTITIIYASGLMWSTYHALRAIIIVNSVLCLIVVVWELIEVLQRAVFPRSSGTSLLRPDFTAIGGKEEGYASTATGDAAEVEEDTKETKETKEGKGHELESSNNSPTSPLLTSSAYPRFHEELQEEAKGDDVGHTEDNEGEELRQLDSTELSPSPSELVPQSDEDMSTQSILQWLWRCFYVCVPLDCLYVPVFAAVFIPPEYLIALLPLSPWT